MDSEKLDKILNIIKLLAETDDEILAIGLRGSWARGTAGADSDIDLSILVKDKLRYKRTDWIEAIDFRKVNEELDYFTDKTYGRVWSRHVFLKSKTEIEFSFADKSWADSDNPDDGTIKVISDGYQILYDPHLILRKLVDKIMTL